MSGKCRLGQYRARVLEGSSRRVGMYVCMYVRGSTCGGLGEVEARSRGEEDSIKDSSKVQSRKIMLGALTRMRRRGARRRIAVVVMARGKWLCAFVPGTWRIPLTKFNDPLAVDRWRRKSVKTALTFSGRRHPQRSGPTPR